MILPLTNLEGGVNLLNDGMPEGAYDLGRLYKVDEQHVYSVSKSSVFLIDFVNLTISEAFEFDSQRGVNLVDGGIACISGAKLFYVQASNTEMKKIVYFNQQGYKHQVKLL